MGTVTRRSIEDFEHAAARVLSIHAPIFDDVDGVPEGHVRCNWGQCPFQIAPEAGEEEAYWWHGRFADHQAEMIMAILR